MQGLSLFSYFFFFQISITLFLFPVSAHICLLFSLFFRANRGVTWAWFKFVSPGENHKMTFFMTRFYDNIAFSGCWKEVGLFQSCTGTQSMTQMCKADRNSGHLANKLEAGRGKMRWAADRRT